MIVEGINSIKIVLNKYGILAKILPHEPKCIVIDNHTIEYKTEELRDMAFKKIDNEISD